MYKSPADMAKEIRTALKEKGITSRQVSVRSGYCGYSDYIHAYIKDCSIDIRDIEKAVAKYESIRYDEYTQEILSGANTYTRVEYNDDAFDAVIPKYLDDAKSYMEQIQDFTGADLGNEFYLFKENGRYIVHDNNTYTRTCIYSPKQLARELYMIETHKHI